MEEVDEGNVAVVEDASCSDREVVLTARTGPAVAIAVLCGGAGSQLHVGLTLWTEVVRT